LFLLSALGAAQLQITTSSVPNAAQYLSYNTPLNASGGVPPYLWSVVTSTGVSLPEGMTLAAATGVISAAQVNGQGGYAVTIQVTDSALPVANTAQATINFGVTSDGAYGGCQMFPPDSVYNQRIDMLPADQTPANQIPSASLNQPLHPDFGQGFYPFPGGIPFMRVPANQPTTHVVLSYDGQIDLAATYSWPFPPWPSALLEGTSYGADGADHHTLILQSSANTIAGPQTGPCTLYETYQSSAVQSMYNAATATWVEGAGIHYVLNSDEIAASADTLDSGAQDSPGIPMVPLLIKYWEVPLGVRHPLRITMPSPTNQWVWPGTGCCSGSGPPQGLLFRLKANVSWQAVCPVNSKPQAATVLQALQQYGAYMSDHGSAGFIQGVPDIRWDDGDLACIKNFPLTDLEVVNNSLLEVSPISGQTRPYVPPATLPNAVQGAGYSAPLSATGGNQSSWVWSVTSGSLPPGLALNSTTGVIAGISTAAPGAEANFAIALTDAAAGNASPPQSFSITTAAPPNTVVITSLTNAASGAAGVIAPGELVTIKGSLLGPATGVSFSVNPVTGMVATALGGTQVSFGSFAAPILYSSATQINAIVPWEVAGQSQLTMQVQYSGFGSASLANVPVASAAPGIFTFDSSGSGPAVAANQDGTFNGPTIPAAPGSYVTVYFTGGGITSPPGVTGSVTGSVLETLTQISSVTATVGGVPASVSFAGAAPGLVNGVNQLNIQLSAATPTGTSQPLMITVGAQRSTATATLSVK